MDGEELVVFFVAQAEREQRVRVLFAEIGEAASVEAVAQQWQRDAQQARFGPGDQYIATAAQHDDVCEVVVEARAQPAGVLARLAIAFEQAADEGEVHLQTVNDEPQPQVVFAFGLRITNCAPCRLSL